MQASPRGFRRRGLAPLEFVLVFPMLLAIVSGIFLAARADLAKTLSATQARDEAWRRRPDANPGAVLRLFNDPASSVVEATKTIPLPPAALFRSANFRAVTTSSVLGQTWDHRQLPFAPGRPALDPHRDELARLAGNVPGLDLVVDGGLKLFAFGMNPDRNPALFLVAMAVKPANGVVAIAGWVLKVITAGPVFAAQAVLEVLKGLLEVGSWFGAGEELRVVKSALRVLDIGLSCFENLYQASRGFPGEWDTEGLSWLNSFRP